jgi:endonuclease/exonuclease/phosphatase family metal-dependent hydrolase
MCGIHRGLNWFVVIRSLLMLLSLLAVSLSAAGQNLTVMTWNVKGNGVADWTTNNPQVRAIGRVLSHLDPDVVTFQEIPLTNTFRMPAIIAEYLPGFFLATNSGTDGFIRSVIVSRYPITRSQRWLDGVNLNAFGYAGTFTRDLFEAEINVPFYTAPLHVFTTHLKSGGTADDFARRGAEALAISNFFATNFLPTRANRPHVLTGDLNEDVASTSTNSLRPVTRLTNAPSALRLISPVNPSSGSVNTFSIQASVNTRLDYLLPGGPYRTNLIGSQVFRSDRVTPLPPELFSTDNATASDHLPVLATFANPYAAPFLLTGIVLTNQNFRLNWQATPGQTFFVQASTNLSNWAFVATNRSSNSLSYTSVVSGTGNWRFFRLTQ